MNLESLQHEIYQKIGKNVMLFQKLEHILKYIIHFKSFKACGSQIHENNKLKDSVSIKSMGQLINEFLANDKISPTPKVDVSKDIFFSSHIEISLYFINEKSKTLKKLLEERNKLIHHSFLAYNMDTVTSCIAIISSLDEQQVRIKNEINELVPIAQMIKNFKEMFLDYIKSGNLKKEFDLDWLRNSELVMEIAKIFKKTVREDGWATLSVLGREIRKTSLDEVKLLKKKYNCKSLKQLLTEAEMFDLKEEGTLVLYRIKPEFLRTT